jgi:hypothetical protein
MKLLQRFDLPGFVFVTWQIELQEGAKEKASTPQPLRTLMIITSFGDDKIITVIAVNVVWAVIHVGGIESAHAGGTTKDSVGELQTFKSVTLIEKFGSDSHRNGKVGAELVICPLVVGPIDIFVDTATVDGSRIYVVQGIFLSIYRSVPELKGTTFRDVIATLKGFLDLFTPFPPLDKF